MLASFDAVALDKACIDAVNAAPVIPGTVLSDTQKETGADSCACTGESDHFHVLHPTTNWRSQIAHAEAIGLGSGTYELITVK